jgi:hypothetical protein
MRAPAAQIAWERTSASLSLADVEAVTRTLGFLPSNACAVAARDGVSGLPTILQMYPLSTELSVSRGGAAGRATLTRTQPWPTLFWLICPLLRADVSKLESVGFVPFLQARPRRCLALGSGLLSECVPFSSVAHSLRLLRRLCSRLCLFP